MLMDEAYRHHKKFRNSKRESTSPAPSTAVSSATSPSLASSHSTLVKTLEQAPRYLNEQQMKRTDLIHNIIMRTEAALPSSTSSTPVPPPTMDRHPQFPLQQQALGKGVLVGPHGYYIPAPFNTTGCQQYQSRVNGSSSSYPQSLSPRVMYSSTGSSNGDQVNDGSNSGGILTMALTQAQQRRSPMVSPVSASNSSLVMGTSSKSAAPQLHHHLTSPHHHHHHLLTTSRSPSSSPIILVNSSSSAAIKSSPSSSDNMSDSQPLNLSMSKRVSTNSPTVKMESS